MGEGEKVPRSAAAGFARRQRVRRVIAKTWRGSAFRLLPLTPTLSPSELGERESEFSPGPSGVRRHQNLRF